MVERITEELLIPRQFLSLNTAGEPYGVFQSETDSHRFPFELWRKAARFGDVPIDQWWMPAQTVYGQRNNNAINSANLVGYYWALCLREGTVFEDSVQETYILASILPLVRSTGGRRVFADAQPYRRASGAPLRTVAAELQELLETSRGFELSTLAFHEHVMNTLGPPEYEPEVHTACQEFSAQLLGEAREALEREGTAGLEVARNQWLEWNRTIGRRRGNETQKQALDVLSYECRTALHTCYSAVWFDLIQHLGAKYGWSDESLLFHWLWHFDLRDNIEQPETEQPVWHLGVADGDDSLVLPNNRLFHGHVFALHPACANFAITRRGRELLGAFLIDPSSEQALHLLLGGLYVAIDDYAGRQDLYALLRKGPRPSFDPRRRAPSRPPGH